eukprot:scaffold15301_cov142-Cylindrotheca_fusiformis.AAC.7
MSNLLDQTNFFFDHQRLLGQRFCAILPRPFPEDSFYHEIGELDANKEKESLDRHLSASMGKLSLKDRETALEEVHGIVKNDREDVAFLQSKLQAMEECLSSIKRGTVYEKAEAIDPYFVSSREIRLLFLRGNRYDPQAGAEQLIKHFDRKFSLFGSEKLTRNITLYDLDDNDRMCLESGFCQILPQKDVAGRAILLILPGLRPDLDVQHGLRAMYYLCMTTLQESEEIQKKGIVKLAYAVGRYKTRTNEAGLAQVAQCVSSTPFPLGGMHLCFNASDYLEYVCYRAIILALPTSAAAKTRTHFGTHMDCLYALRGYGIVEGSLPLSQITANPLLHNHMTWYENRIKVDLNPVKPHTVSSSHETLVRKQDSENGDVTATFVCPSLTRKIEPRWGDILVSRLIATLLTLAKTRLNFPKFGRQHQVHPGNIRLKKLLMDHSAEYEAIDGKKGKMAFAQNFVTQMKASGSRFLTFDQDIEAWTEVCDKRARNKVSKTIRNSRRYNS